MADRRLQEAQPSHTLPVGQNVTGRKHPEEVEPLADVHISMADKEMGALYEDFLMHVTRHCPTTDDPQNIAQRRLKEVSCSREPALDEVRPFNGSAPCEDTHCVVKRHKAMHCSAMAT
jgi:hypothetical protein